MGIIYHNGLPYCGGGSGSSAAEKELTYAEYLALTEEEKNNGTTYYITDVDNNGNISGYTAGDGIEISEDKVVSNTLKTASDITCTKIVYEASGISNPTEISIQECIDKDTEELSSLKYKINENKRTLGYTCKNLLPYPHANSTTTTAGIKYTDNGDGTVTASGTSTGAANFMCKRRTDNNFKLPKGKYILSGCPTGGSSDTYEIQMGRSNDEGSYVDMGRDYGNGLTFEITEDLEDNPLQVMISIKKSGIVANNLVFKPMVRLAPDEDATYEPYRENVDDRLAELEDKFPAAGSIPTINTLPNPSSANNSSSFKYWKNPFGEIHFHIDFIAKTEIDDSLRPATLYTLPEGYRPSTEFEYRALMRYYNSETQLSDIGICYLTIKPDGSVSVTGELLENPGSTIPATASIGFGGVII